MNAPPLYCDISLPLITPARVVMERTLTAAYDLEEIVDLFAIDRSPGNAELMPIKIASLPLRKAVVLVIEDWSGDKFRQLTAVIRRRSGPAIRNLADIRKLYVYAAAASMRRAERVG